MNLFKKKEKDTPWSDIKKKRHSSMIYDNRDVEQTEIQFRGTYYSDDTDDSILSRHNYEKESEDSIVAKNVIKFSSSLPTQQKQTGKAVVQCCEMCNNRNCSENDNFIILNCKHVYHIKCLADEHHYEAKQNQYLDDKFFESRKCGKCSTRIEKEEIHFIHCKFFKGTKEHLDSHELQINKLELQMNKLKEELKTSIEYKQKLEYEREKSKQIITMLNTMM
jgi:hypothetical protein